MLASIFQTIAALISGFTTTFWFMVFFGAMALLIFMPQPSPKPKAEGAPAAPQQKDGEEAKWRQMLYATDAKWRRMLVMMHLQNAKQAAQPQPPIHINVVATPEMLSRMNSGDGIITVNGSGQLLEGPAQSNSGNAPPNGPRKKFRLPRAPKLSLPRKRIAAKSTADDI